MLGKIRSVSQLWHFFGIEWLVYRIIYTIRLRTGIIRRRLPATPWGAQPLKDFFSEPSLAEPEVYLNYRQKNAPPFFFKPSNRNDYFTHFSKWDKGANSPIVLANEIGKGNFRYFEHSTAQVGFPPDWHCNPFNGQTAPADRHWSRIPDFGHGDIKVIWEPNRFWFVYALVRAYWRSGDERYADIFWKLVESWQMHNPPQLGLNWKCGQEVTFRVMAWCFGLYGFLDAKVTSPGRVQTLIQMIAVSGQRIEANMGYALSQKNNHGISEGVGLWTIALLFPEFHRAKKWRELGRQVLERLGKELIYNDGSFAQHSVNYHRLMLHDYLWALRLGDLQDQPLSSELKERVAKAGALLYQIQDEKTGRVPYYGQNDGALVLPLNNCDYQDFRPVIQATHYYCTSSRCYQPGPWDEDLLWLFGSDALKAPAEPPQRIDVKAEIGGYYTLRSKSGFAFVRCASFRHRPGQADMLQVDLWWRGQNIAVDAGTYSYNSPTPWNNPLANSAYHNTVTVDGVDQMNRFGKFLWLPWLHSRVRSFQRSSGGSLTYWEGEHNGYRRLKPQVTHRRGILRIGDKGWLVLDALDSTAKHNYRLHWLLPDLPREWNEVTGCMTLHTSVGPYFIKMATFSAEGRGIYSLMRGDEHNPRGWRAPYYFYREPALSVDLILQEKNVLFWTLCASEPCNVTRDGMALKIEGEHWHCLAILHADYPHRSSLIASVSRDGAVKDQLEMSTFTLL